MKITSRGPKFHGSGGQTGRKTDRLVGRQTGRQTDRKNKAYSRKQRFAMTMGALILSTLAIIAISDTMWPPNKDKSFKDLLSRNLKVDMTGPEYIHVNPQSN